jgi:Rps23 Pro-64 3,4-dihydroxylase Tpa1-like proline 4-hydroxylase
MSIINKKYLKLNDLKGEFHKNTPFPHIVMDNFLSEEFYEEFNIKNNKLHQTSGKQFKTDVEKNKWISQNFDLPHKIKLIIDELNNEKWIKSLSDLSLIKDVVGTKIGNTKLANYHEMRNDGYLGPHVDHADDPETGCPHVLNLLLYLSKEWDDEWGGSTLLFDKDGKKIIHEVKYKPNRAILFLHTPYSFHGVKRISNNNQVRSSIYVDYYSKSNNPYKEINLNFKNHWFKHGTCFVLPTLKDYLKIKNLKYTKTYLKYRYNRIFSS